MSVSSCRRSRHPVGHKMRSWNKQIWFEASLRWSGRVPTNMGNKDRRRWFGMRAKVGLKVEIWETKRGGDCQSPGSRLNAVGGGQAAGTEPGGIPSLRSRRKERHESRNKSQEVCVCEGGHHLMPLQSWKALQKVMISTVNPNPLLQSLGSAVKCQIILFLFPNKYIVTN